MRIRKLSNEWTPSENKGLQIGEIIDMSDPKSLVEQGFAVYVDEDGDDWEKIPTAWTYRPLSKEEKIAKKEAIEKKEQEKMTPVEREKVRLEAIRLMKQEQGKKLAEMQQKKREEEKRQKEIKEKEIKLAEQEQKAKEALAEAVKIINEKPL